MITFDDVVDLVQGHYPYPWAKNRSIVFDWLVWFVTKRFAICVTEDHETIAGLGLFRPVMRPEDGHTAYRYDPEGPVIYCDFLYAANNEAMRGIVVEAVHRFGTRTTVAAMRDGKLHSHPAHRFIRRVLKEKHHVPA
jgi:hypothetical protein